MRTLLQAALLITLLSSGVAPGQCIPEWEAKMASGSAALKAGNTELAQKELLDAYQLAMEMMKTVPPARLNAKKQLDILGYNLAQLDEKLLNDIAKATNAQMKKEPKKPWLTQDLALKLYAQRKPVEDAEYSIMIAVHPEQKAKLEPLIAKSRAGYEQLKAARKNTKVK